MPFAEINPPDIPILPGPGYKYLNSCPPTGNVYQDLVDLTTLSSNVLYLNVPPPFMSSPCMDLSQLGTNLVGHS